MASSTVNNSEKNHLSDIIDRLNTSIGLHHSTIILKDGRRITGRVVKTTIADDQAPQKLERSRATVTVHHDIGTFDLDLLNISSVIPGST